MKKINIIDNSGVRLSEVSDMYIQIFGEEPWKEGFQCQSCEKLYALSEVAKNDIKKCLCGSDLSSFYNKEEVENNRKRRSSLKGYIGKIAETMKGDLVGFILGRKSDINTLNKEKLKLDVGSYNEMLNTISDIFPGFDEEKLFYAADIGVKLEYRNQGVASELYNSRENDIRNKGFEYVMVRTTKTSDVPYKWYKNKGFVDVFNYNDAQDRVIMLKYI